ncbi:DNA polymerase IV [Aestuariispira insulae]|uniref:DNA polymerase IV n=1 Tax=Aestuariispira insulae TaxID=1461337 RepID=A0A3D9HPR7_9PROT|nr:DNA polymerase IV [Aestuariispira insulae]RED50896.1 DNA polymerase-4 [Aestuariispira insulae]
MGYRRALNDHPDLHSLCRDCLHLWAGAPGDGRCPRCGSPRLAIHDELPSLSLAHIDCDSFYATVEKRDDPSLRDKPVIIGGGHRGVVSAACYVARVYGVRSAMPMYKALDLCPDAVVIRPNMEKYAAVGQEIRKLMRAVTPLVEPLSIDEAFLDLAGTERLHGTPPAQTLAGLIRRIENRIGVSASVGLSYNKFLAKVASDLEKPRGFAIIGQKEAQTFLADKPVNMIWGVGKALEKKLNQNGFQVIGDLLREDEHSLIKRYGVMGRRLYRFARGQDSRKVEPESETKSISVEYTFDTDIDSFEILAAELSKMCDKLSARMQKKGYGARTVTLKLKDRDFHLITRSKTLPDPTQRAEIFFNIGLDLLKPEINGTAYRLMGIGGSELVEASEADPPSLANPDSLRKAHLDKTITEIREKLGPSALVKGFPPQ